MTPRCPGSGGFPAGSVRTREEGTRPVGECGVCGRTVSTVKAGRLRVHGIASSYQPSLFEEPAR